MHRRVGLSFAILLGLATVAQAASTLVVGPHILAANQNGGAQNTIQISISGNDANIAGAVINAQVADGGPGVAGVIVGPGFTGDMLQPGSLFLGNNTGITDLNAGFVNGNQIVLLQTSTASGVVSDVGGKLLVTLTFDTTGFSSGTWPLIFSGTANGDTGIGSTAGPLNLLITNGSITIVPEPGSIVLGLFAAAGLAAVAVRKNRARRAA